MHRWSALFLCFVLVLAFGLGSVAHAKEGVECVDAASASSFEHSEGDGDEVPGDAEKAYPHHHGGCHCHHVAVAQPGVPFVSGVTVHAVRAVWANAPMAAAPANKTLRPPRA